jgi:hypothetical protein
MSVGGQCHAPGCFTPKRETHYPLYSRPGGPQSRSSSVSILQIGIYDENLFELMCIRNQFSVFHSSFKETVHILHNNSMAH